VGDNADRINEDGEVTVALGVEPFAPPDDFTCTYCGAPMRLRENDYGPWWSCTGWPGCDARVGAHPDGRPLGTPARAELRRWRRAAHLVFDALWRRDRDNPSPPMSRTEAYAWLGRQTAIRHIAECDEHQCYYVIRAVYHRKPS